MQLCAGYELIDDFHEKTPLILTTGLTVSTARYRGDFGDWRNRAVAGGAPV
jgi:hypothetical protein